MKNYITTSTFSVEKFKAFLADKNALFYDFVETKDYGKKADGTEDIDRTYCRLFCEPVADGEHHVDALNMDFHKVLTPLNRPLFSEVPSFHCIGFVVDGKTFYRTDNWLDRYHVGQDIDRNLICEPLYTALTDFIHKTASTEKYLKDPEVITDAHNFAARNYVFDGTKSAVYETCEKWLWDKPDADAIIEYLANPSTWVDAIVKAIDFLPRALNFTTWRRERAAAIDKLIDDNAVSFSQDYADFLNVCKEMYNTIKDKPSVILVLKANGKSKRVQYRTSRLATEGWLLVERKQFFCFGAAPDDKAIRSLQNFLKRNWSKYDPNGPSVFPFATIEKILDVNTKKPIWTNPLFEEGK